MRTVTPCAGLRGEEEAVGEDEDEVEDGEEGEVSPLGLTSASFFRSICLPSVPRKREKESVYKSICVNMNNTLKD